MLIIFFLKNLKSHVLVHASVPSTKKANASTKKANASMGYSISEILLQKEQGEVGDQSITHVNNTNKLVTDPNMWEGEAAQSEIQDQPKLPETLSHKNNIKTK